MLPHTDGSIAAAKEQGREGGAELGALTRWLRARDPGGRLHGRAPIGQGLAAAEEAACSLPPSETLALLVPIMPSNSEPVRVSG